jgi:putative selenate reductase molybdopterin-binding subunit
MVLAAKKLIETNANPGEDDVREALSGVLCRCTGYLKPVQAILEAAAVMRGEDPTDIDVAILDPLTFMPEDRDEPDDIQPPEFPGGNGGPQTQTRVRTLPKFIYAPQAPDLQVVGKPELKVDSIKLAKGNPAFVDDVEMRGMLHAKLLTSPHAHARILSIDESEARNLQGVHAVIHCFNVARVKYASGGQSYPNPKPYDQVSFDTKVRYVGDRVAAVAAESVEIAEEAIKRIKVEYEVLSAVFDAEAAMQDGAPVIHDEDDTEHIHDAARNISHHISAEVGSVAQGFEDADHVTISAGERPARRCISTCRSRASTGWRIHPGSIIPGTRRSTLRPTVWRPRQFRTGRELKFSSTFASIGSWAPPGIAESRHSCSSR